MSVNEWRKLTDSVTNLRSQTLRYEFESKIHIFAVASYSDVVV